MILGLLAVVFLSAGPAVAQPSNGERVGLARESIAAVSVDQDNDTVPDRLDDRVRVSGIVTVEPGVLATEHFQTVVQDDTGGIFLFSYDLSQPLRSGQQLVVEGRVAQFNGATQLQDIRIVSVGDTGPLVTPKTVSASELRNRSHFAQLVRLRGEVEAVDVSRHALIDLRTADGGTMRIFVPEKRVSQIPQQAAERGTRVEVIGVASLHDRAWPYNSGWQIIVTEPGRIELLRAPRPAWWPWLKWIALAALLMLSTLLVVIFIMARRRRLRQREINTLNALSSALGIGNLSASQLAERACISLCQYELFDVAALHAFDEYGRLRLLAVSENDAELRDMLDHGQLRAVSEEDESPSLSAEKHDLLSAQLAEKGLGMMSLRPLLGRDRPIGYLSLFSRKGTRLGRAQRRLLASGSKLIALGLEHIADQVRNENERAELNALANTDALTGLYNRRFLEDYLRIQTALVKRRGSNLAFFAVDVDHFKQLNDNYGHDVGDAVLVKLAALMQDSTRASDLVVRQGGEEFLVVCSDCSSVDAVDFGERLRKRVAETDFSECGLEAGVSVTVSIGVACFPENGDSPNSVIRLSDQALYRAKQSGRNRVSI
jgi:diguanylate cyclase (GGDEF)-like protein